AKFGPSTLSCSTLGCFQTRLFFGDHMSKLFLFILLLSVSVTASSACSARGGGSYIHVPAKSVSNYRAPRFVYPAPAYRSTTPRAYVPRHQPRYAAQPSPESLRSRRSSIQHSCLATPSTPTLSVMFPSAL